jgi:hypothetical protein
VVQTLRKIASLGRSIVCTIHQPSAELFFHFDDLLLLKSGGKTVYYGPIGFRGSSVRQYFEGLPGVSRMPRRMNPASWVVDVVSGAAQSVSVGTSSVDERARELANKLATPYNPATPDFPVLYAQSAAKIGGDAMVQAALVRVAALPCSALLSAVGATACYGWRGDARCVSLFLPICRAMPPATPRMRSSKRRARHTGDSCCC